jgi:excisionase family DNA binding protein
MPRLSVKQLAQRYGVSKAIIYVWVDERRFPVFRIGARLTRGRILIEENDFSTFLESLKVNAEEPRVKMPLQHIHM